MNQKTFGLLLMGLGAGVILGALILVGSFWFGPTRSSRASSDAASGSIGISKGKSAPDFSLVDLDGEKVELSQYFGKPIFINFWATWCGPCREEMPLIQAYADTYSTDMVVLAINYDEPESRVKEFLEALGLTVPVLLDPGGKTNHLYRVSAYPTSYFIDSEGVIQAKHIGLISEAQLVSYLGEIGVGE